MSNIYHYTNLKSFLEILKGDKVRLILTNVRYLNDEEETREGLRRLREIANEGRTENEKQLGISVDEDIIDNAFTASFAHEVNSVPLWAMYANQGKGIAIGFDMDKLKEYFEQEGLGFCKCMYDSSKITKESTATPSSECPSSALNNQFWPLFEDCWSLCCACLQCKHPAYAYEKEYRVFWVNETPFRGNRYKIKYREKKDKVVPYIEIEIDKALVTKVIIGPAHKDDPYQKKAITEFLKSCDYNCEVENSTLSYRDF